MWRYKFSRIFALWPHSHSLSIISKECQQLSHIQWRTPDKEYGQWCNNADLRPGHSLPTSLRVSSPNIGCSFTTRTSCMLSWIHSDWLNTHTATGSAPRLGNYMHTKTNAAWRAKQPLNRGTWCSHVHIVVVHGQSLQRIWKTTQFRHVGSVCSPITHQTIVLRVQFTHTLNTTLYYTNLPPLVPIAWRVHYIGKRPHQALPTHPNNVDRVNS